MILQFQVTTSQPGCGTVTAGGDGAYNLDAAPRPYTVTASAPGHRSQSKSVTVQPDLAVIVNFDLAPGWEVHLPLVVKAR